MRNGAAASGSPEVRLPAEAVAGRRPDPHVSGVDVGAEYGAVVEHRVDEQLEHRLRPAVIVKPLGQRGGKAAAGAATADRDPLRVDAELMGVDADLVPPVVEIIQRGGSRVFGGEAVGRGEHDDAEPLGEPDEEAVVLLRGTHHESAPMNPKERRGSAVRDTWTVDAIRELAARSAHEDGGDIHVGGGGVRPRRPTKQAQGGAGDSGARQPPRGAEVGVERFRSGHQCAAPGRCVLILRPFRAGLFPHGDHGKV